MTWTYGAELELSDWPRHEPLPVAGMGIDVRDVTMVNSDGVAVDPQGKAYHLGGEIQTAPSESPSGVSEQLAAIMKKWPQTTVNYRSNLHVHVRVPGLKEDLFLLKKLQAYAHRWLPEVLSIIEPIPRPKAQGSPEVHRGALQRWRRRKVSHQQLMKPAQLAYQLEASTVQEFREREVRNRVTGQLHWVIHPRLCFNLRQLWETDTIEFRHFPGTTNPQELDAAVRWCSVFLSRALADDVPLKDAHLYSEILPVFQGYDHWLETGYAATSVKYHSRAELPARITEWLSRGKRP